MTILHITPTYKPAYIYGGVTVSISLLCETLAAAGHDVTVATATSNGKEDLPAFIKEPKLVDGVKTYYFPRLIKGAQQLTPQLQWWLWKNIKKYDIVHIHSWWNLDTLCTMAICKLKGIKPVFSPRGMLSNYSTSNPIRRFFNKYIGNWLFKNSYLHATAIQELDECLHIKPDWQYSVLPNLLNLKIPKKKAILVDNTEGVLQNSLQLSESYNSQNSTFTLLFFSRIHPKKGLENLFEALSNVPFDWSLTMAGDGEIEYIQALKNKAKEWLIDTKINWIGWVNPNEKYSVLQNADLMVLPSFSENFANVVIESLAVGTPVLISNKTGLSDYVLEKDLGWVCETTIESIEKTLIDTYYDDRKREEIAEKSPHQIQSDFTPSVLVKQYVKMYENCNTDY